MKLILLVKNVAWLSLRGRALWEGSDTWSNETGRIPSIMLEKSKDFLGSWLYQWKMLHDCHWGSGLYNKDLLLDPYPLPNETGRIPSIILEKIKDFLGSWLYHWKMLHDCHWGSGHYNKDLLLDPYPLPNETGGRIPWIIQEKSKDLLGSWINQWKMLHDCHWGESSMREIENLTLTKWSWENPNDYPIIIQGFPRNLSYIWCRQVVKPRGLRSRHRHMRYKYR